MPISSKDADIAHTPDLGKSFYTPLVTLTLPRRYGAIKGIDKKLMAGDWCRFHDSIDCSASESG